MDAQTKLTTYEKERKGGFVKALDYQSEAINEEYAKIDSLKEDDVKIKDIAYRFIMAEEMHNRLKEITTFASKLCILYREKLIPELVWEKHGQKSVLCDEYGKVGVVISQALTVSAADKQDAIEWLKEHGLGGFVAETITAEALKELAKMIEGEELKIEQTLDSSGEKTVREVYATFADLPPIFKYSDRMTTKFEKKGSKFINPKKETVKQSNKDF